MTFPRLDHPVRTLGGQELLPAGTELSGATLDAVASAGRSQIHKKLPILSYGSVRKDILQFLGQPPYDVIFDGSEKTAAFLAGIQETSTPLPVLESLDYFRSGDFYTYRHVLIVFALSNLMARILLENDQDLRVEALAGPAHDFGKISVPLEILKKNNPLTRTERGILEHHCLAGYVLLTYYQGEEESFLARVARDHHERRDGSGYPLGGLLEDRLIEIVAAADIYDALISVRPYRRAAYDNRTALEEITEMAVQGKLSWEVVKTLISLNRRAKPREKARVVSVEKRGKPPKGNLYGVIEDEEKKD